MLELTSTLLKYFCPQRECFLVFRLVNIPFKIKNYALVYLNSLLLIEGVLEVCGGKMAVPRGKVFPKSGRSVLPEKKDTGSLIFLLKGFGNSVFIGQGHQPKDELEVICSINFICFHCCSAAYNVFVASCRIYNNISLYIDLLFCSTDN